MIRVKDYPNYSVTEDGRVFNHLSDKWATITKLSTFGYKGVSLVNSEGRRSFAVHRLVAQAFIPNFKNKPEVNHKDHNKINNHASNLEWCTRRENVDKAMEAGRYNNMKTAYSHTKHHNAGDYPNCIKCNAIIVV